MPYDLTLAQSSCNSLVFSDLSNEDLGEKIGNAVEDSGCWFKTRTYSPGAHGNEDIENIPPWIHAVGHHWSGNIWIATCSKAELTHKVLYILL